MFQLIKSWAIISSILLAGQRASAWDAWHMDNAYVLTTERLDPVVNPNAISSHMHKVFGGSGFSAGYSQDTYQNAQCSSIGLQADKSDYWAPELYWMDNSTQQFVPVPVNFRWYYFLIGSSPTDVVQPFPAGLRFISGSPNSKAPVNVRRMIFSCLPAQGVTSVPTGTDFNFDMECPSGMQVEIYFPSCWDGINLWTKDNSHVTWSVNFDAGDGGCPMTHPIRIPTIMGEWHFNPQLYAPGQKLKGNLAWANGDTTGYGFHSDFANGWNLDLLQAALNDPGCRNTTGSSIGVNNCPTFAPYYSAATAQKCTKPDLGQLQEPAGNTDLVPIAALPGCNPVWGASGPKPGCSSTNDPDASPYYSTVGPTTASKPQNFVLPTTPGWNWLSCVSDKTALLNATSYYDSSMTHERCQGSCAVGGYTYAGLGMRGSNIYDCVCSNNLDLSNAAVSPGSCTSPCPGNSTQTCGASYKYEIFYAPEGTASIPSKVYASNATYIGCYNTLGSGGLTSVSTYNFTSKSMTIDTCFSACSQQKAAWGMLDQGNRCRCGNSFTYGSVNFYPDSNCNTPCSGNSTEMCGGTYAGSLFNLTATQMTSATVVRPQGYQGCFAEAAKGLALSNNSWSSGSMTEQSCVDGCSELGYKYAGVKLGRSCYCGDTFNGGQSLPSSQCSMACSGDSTQTCGAAAAYDLFLTNSSTVTLSSSSAGSGETYLGCFADASTAPILSNYSYSTATMTRETCFAACQEMGWSYAGLETGRTCKCGDLIPQTLQQPSAVSCALNCSGDATEKCGGYGYAATYQVRSNTTNLATGSSGTSDYVGCYANASPGLKNYTVSFGSIMSTDTCRTTCSQFGYSLAAVQSTTCYCGDTWVGGQALPSSSCTTSCAGNSSLTCGGTNAASVWKTENAPPLPYHQPGWLGCWTDTASTHALSSYTYSSGSMTTRACRMTCKGSGYSYAGLLGGTTCYCGDSLLSSSTVQPGLLCSKACSGNSSESCGASSYRIDLYNATSVVTSTASSPAPSSVANSTTPNSSNAIGSNSTTNSGSGSTTSSAGYSVSASHCYSDYTKLTGPVYKSDWLSQDICNAFCVAQGYQYAGVRLGSTCQCGNTAPVNVLPSASCVGACTADPTQNCGSSSGAIISTLVNGTGIRTGYILNANASGFAGCFQDNAQQFLPVNAFSSSNMSQTFCAQNCAGLGYTYAGIRGGTQCFCGSSFTPSASAYQIAAGDCNIACATGGGACGGTNRVSLFEISKVPTVVPTVAVEGYLGCYAPGKLYTSAPFNYSSNVAMTTDVCRRTCRLKGYSVAGLTNSNTCYCADSQLYGSVQAQAMCDLSCVGNSNQNCGGSHSRAVSIFDTTGPGAQPPSTYASDYIGCFIDSGSVKVLNSYQFTSAGMTPSLCQRQCASSGYTVSGVEHNNYCYCGSSFPATGLLPDSQCTLPCSGVASMTCGGVYNVQVYTTSLYTGGSSVSNGTGVGSPSSAPSTIGKPSVSIPASSAANVTKSVASTAQSSTVSIVTKSSSSIAASASSIKANPSSAVPSSLAESSFTHAATSSSKPAVSVTTSQSSPSRSVSSISSVTESKTASTTSVAVVKSSSSSTASSVTASSTLIPSKSVVTTSVTSVSSVVKASSSSPSVRTSEAKSSTTASSTKQSVSSSTTTSVDLQSFVASVTASTSTVVPKPSSHTSAPASTTTAESISKQASTVTSISKAPTVVSQSTARTSTSVTPSPSTVAATLPGCYSGTTTSFATLGMTSVNITAELCSTWCKGNNYAYSGLSTGSYCGCSDDISSLTALPTSSCSAITEKQPGETCGEGPGDVYMVQKAVMSTKRTVQFGSQRRKGTRIAQF